VLNKRASICTPLVEVHVRNGKSAEKQLHPKSKKVKTGGNVLFHGARTGNPKRVLKKNTNRNID